MLIKIGNRFVNTDHIVRAEKNSDRSEYGLTRSKPNMCLIMNEQSGEVGHAFNGAGTWGATSLWFFGNTAKELDNILSNLAESFIEIDEDEPTP